MKQKTSGTSARSSFSERQSDACVIGKVSGSEDPSFGSEPCNQILGRCCNASRLCLCRWNCGSKGLPGTALACRRSEPVAGSNSFLQREQKEPKNVRKETIIRYRFTYEIRLNRYTIQETSRTTLKLLRTLVCC